MLIMLVLGLGLGMVMQVLVIAVQNAVDYATSAWPRRGPRSSASSAARVGTAALGAIFAARLRTRSSRGCCRRGRGRGRARERPDPGGDRRPAPAERAAYAAAFTAAIDSVFLVAAVIAAVGFVLALLLPERPLRATVAATRRRRRHDVGEAFPMPTATGPAGAAGARPGRPRRPRRAARPHRAHRRAAPASGSAPPRPGCSCAWAKTPSLDPIALGRAYGVAAGADRGGAGRAARAQGMRRRSRRDAAAVTTGGCDAFTAAWPRRAASDWRSCSPTGRPEKHERAGGRLAAVGARGWCPTCPPRRRRRSNSVDGPRHQAGAGEAGGATGRAPAGAGRRRAAPKKIPPTTVRKIQIDIWGRSAVQAKRPQGPIGGKSGRGLA